MKKAFFLGLLLAGQLAVAGTTEVQKKTVTLPVDIGTTKIKFTNLGYGDNYLVKIIVPELAAETLLNHRNLGEDGPCLFTNDAASVADVVQNRPEVVQVPFEITLVKDFWIDKQNNTCLVTLKEKLSAEVRGFHFQHQKSISLPSRHVDDCK